MISISTALHVIVLYLAVLLTTVYTEDVCVNTGPCKCEFPNGTGIDLSPTTKSTFFTTQTYQLKNSGTRFALSTFFYHPCYDVQLPLNTSSANVTTCTSPLAICWYVKYMDQNTTNTFIVANDNYQYLGSSNNSKFSADGKSIIYSNAPSSTVVMLICAQTDDQFSVYSLEDPAKINQPAQPVTALSSTSLDLPATSALRSEMTRFFKAAHSNTQVLSFYSKEACLKQLEEVGRSLGSTLLIIFFSFVILYLVLGICTKKFLMGATGIEVIPNLAFWSDLPNLVKDGWAFAMNGFKLPARAAGPVMSPDPNSYDSI